MRYFIEEIPNYKKSILDAIVVISTSGASNENDICNLQEAYYLLDAVEQIAKQEAQGNLGDLIGQAFAEEVKGQLEVA